MKANTIGMRLQIDFLRVHLQSGWILFNYESSNWKLKFFNQFLGEAGEASLLFKVIPIDQRGTMSFALKIESPIAPCQLLLSAFSILKEYDEW